jgi:hypothetical protein
VAEKVGKRYPDKLLLFLAYSQYRTPPKRMKLHKNIIVQFCVSSYMHGKKSIKEEDMNLLGKFKSCSSRLGIYDYFINGANGTIPRGFSRIVSSSIKEYHKIGCTYFATQAGMDFAQNGFSYFLATRLLWDIESDFEMVLDDYCASAFGKAADVMKRYFLAFIDIWEQHEDKELSNAESVASLYSISWRSERRMELEQAVFLSRKDTQSLRRVEFIEKGMVFLDKYCDAIFAINELREIMSNADNSESFIEEKRQSAAVSRKKLLTWVDEHRDDFVVSAMWFDYQRICRNGLIG